MMNFSRCPRSLFCVCFVSSCVLVLALTVEHALMRVEDTSLVFSEAWRVGVGRRHHFRYLFSQPDVRLKSRADYYKIEQNISLFTWLVYGDFVTLTVVFVVENVLVFGLEDNSYAFILSAGCYQKWSVLVDV